MKNNQWQKTVSQLTTDKRYVVTAPNEIKTQNRNKAPKLSSQKPGRRYSFDDNGGSYTGL